MKIQVVDALLAKLRDEESDHEVLTNCLAALTEIMNAYTTFSDGKTVLLSLISEANLVSIFGSVTSKTASSKIVLHNASLICSLVSLFNTVEVN